MLWIALTVLSNVLYHVFQKFTPTNVNPVLALLVTYLVAALLCALLLPLFPLEADFGTSLRQLNWASFALGGAVLGLELGFLLAYREGWKISLAAIISNVAVGIVLLPIGLWFFREHLSPINLLGIGLCLVGLIMVTYTHATPEPSSALEAGGDAPSRNTMGLEDYELRRDGASVRVRQNWQGTEHGGVTRMQLQSAQSPNQLETRSLRYLALGDSYTIGESVSEVDRFPAQLTRRLRREGIQVEEPEIIARTGWTTDELMGGIAQQPPTGTYDLVTLLIGVNNQYRGRAAEEYRTDLRTLLAQAITYAGGRANHVVVLSIPDWGMTRFGKANERGGIPADHSMNRKVSTEIDSFNAINRAAAEQAGAHYVDITPLTRRVPDDDALCAADGLHPSGKLYAQWVELLLPVATRILQT